MATAESRRVREDRRIELYAQQRGSITGLADEKEHNRQVHSKQRGDISLDPSPAARIKRGYDSIKALVANSKRK